MLSHRLITAGAGLAAVTLLATAPAAAAAPTTYTVTHDPVQAAAGWLTTQFVDPTHLPTPAGDHFDYAPFQGTYFANYGENADVIFALAAAKSGKAGIGRATAYLAAHVDDYADISHKQFFGPADGSIGKMALAATVAGANPTSFGGTNLLARLKADECVSACDAGVVPGEGKNLFDTSINESFVILAEARAGGAYSPSVAATTYFLSLQCADGGFSKGATACGARNDAQVDETSYALMALTALGGHAAQVHQAVAWLGGHRTSGGYWVAQGIANANSTGLATAALQGAGADVSPARRWLRSQQVLAGSAGAGAIRYGGTVQATTAKSGTSPSVLATAQAVTGLVDGGGLATVTATGAPDAAAVFAPTARLSVASARVGQRAVVTAAAFLAGERVRVVIGSTPVGTARANALGVAILGFTVPGAGGIGARPATLTGLNSHLSASRPFAVLARRLGSTAGPRTSVAPSTSSSSTSAGVAGVSASTTPSTEALADSGRDDRTTTALGIIGALAVAVGSGLLVVGRRRSH